MGVRSVNGQGVELAPTPAARSPASRPPALKAETGAALLARVPPDPNQETVLQAKDVVQESFALQRTGTRLRVDATSKRIVAEILDENNEVIKQIPPEELLRIAAKFRELCGILFDEKA